ncbi:Ser/Thr protein kinase RdoA (MazF antagonist) [Paenibacillus cellulosilyticus]|uniref:Ser/Thr protein kinase RdoA (MazF antagonist) n=1 Tax=Paenibacillus cellulosilyticus TaxID=375489 RepID=A0A2V2YY51_9BACL|nr:phosphotransferase [Paenibacillus cellulosilyticus]PWV97881.1 Ser/Thr protein kinase RdoA (MazF antagonist) [Paenibacillus cellulosilyticus]QKS46948.1 phosphotransferase [Paenibacillus cellulosilyticus]
MTDTIDTIIEHYFPLDHVSTEPVPFGLTNTTRFVTVQDRKYVVRHYNRYTKSQDSLSLEMKVTSFLNELPLAFEIPAFLPTRNGEGYVILSDGTLGALVTYIEGAAPPLSTLADANALGQVVGEVSVRLREFGELKDCHPYTGIPFTDFYRLHPLATREAAAAFWETPPFPITDEQRRIYEESLASVEANRDALSALPRQVVHHDLLVFNLLAVEQRITGVLDFDFLAEDIRFLEFAISLNHVLHMSGGSLEMAQAFIEGYALYGGCTYEEMQQLRTLTRLYHIAVLHIYIGQNRSGKDNAAAFAYIANQLIERDNWLQCHEDQLKTLLEPLLRAVK